MPLQLYPQCEQLASILADESFNLIWLGVLPSELLGAQGGLSLLEVLFGIAVLQTNHEEKVAHETIGLVSRIAGQSQDRSV